MIKSSAVIKTNVTGRARDFVSGFTTILAAGEGPDTEKDAAKIKILHLEDLDSDVKLVNQILRKENIIFECLVVDSKDKFITGLKEFSPDIILADNFLPSFGSQEALQIFQQTGMEIPFIIVTAHISEEFAVDIIKRGADDYILKDKIEWLPSAINNALKKFRAVKDRQNLLEDLLNSGKRYQALIESNADAMIIFDKKGVPTYASPSIHKVLGYSDRETLQLKIYEIMHPDDRENAARNTIECLEKPGVTIAASPRRIKHKDGRWIWLETMITNMLNNPVIKGIVESFRDISERKLAEERVINNEQKFCCLVENSIDGIAIITPEGKTLYVSQSVFDILGYTPQEATELSFSTQACPGDLLPGINSIALDVLKNGAATNEVAKKMLHKDGSWRLISGIIKDLSHEPGIGGMVYYFRDVTDIKTIP